MNLIRQRLSYNRSPKRRGRKTSYQYYLYKLTGGYTTSPEGALRLHNKDDDKGFEVSGLDTIVL